MIQAHYIWSDNVARLHRNFSKFHGGFSKFVFNAHKIEDKHGETAFGNEGWFYSLLLKTKKVVQILEQNRGKHCLILDIDIYIYNEMGLFQFLLERAEHSSFTAILVSCCVAYSEAVSADEPHLVAAGTAVAQLAKSCGTGHEE